MATDTPTYLPRMRTRIGKAGYKGKNIRIVEPEDMPTAAVVTAPAGTTVPKAAAPRRGGRRNTAPKAGLKPLKSTGKK